MVTDGKKQTNHEWLYKLAAGNASNEYDDAMMQAFCRKIGLPRAVVTCGIVYLEGYGHPVDIHTVARQILEVGKLADTHKSKEE